MAKPRMTISSLLLMISFFPYYYATAHRSFPAYHPEIVTFAGSLLTRSALERLRNSCEDSDAYDCLYSISDVNITLPPISAPAFGHISVTLLCLIQYYGSHASSSSTISQSQCMKNLIGQNSDQIIEDFVNPPDHISQLFTSHCEKSTFSGAVSRIPIADEHQLLEFANFLMSQIYQSGCFHLSISQDTFKDFYLSKVFPEVDNFTSRDFEDAWVTHEFDVEELSVSLAHLEHCFEAKRVLDAYSLTNTKLNEQDMVDLCPAIIYRLLNPACHTDHEHHEEDSHVRLKTGYVYGTLAITCCSLLALLGIPLVLLDRQKDTMQMLLQAFIGLAVSSMAGDAILHLWPQAIGVHKPHGSAAAIVEHDHEEKHGAEEDHMFLWKSLAVLGSLYMFFIFETLMHQSIDHRHTHSLAAEEVEARRHDRSCHSSSHHHHHHHNDHEITPPPNPAKPGGDKPHPHSHAHGGGKRSPRDRLVLWLCKDRARTHTDSCAGPNGGMASRNSSVDLTGNHYLPISDGTNCKGDLDDDCSPKPETILAVTAPACDVTKEEEAAAAGTVPVEGHVHIVFEKGSHGGSRASGSVAADADSGSGRLVDSDEVWGIPRDKLALVMMITMGDMFHNLSDGLAVGAAFAGGGMNSGISTSMAVLCHELPHELGDFAILYDCGLSMWRILLLNALSSVASYIGLFIGIGLSSTNSTAHEWIFAVTAGMFLYVAFIDMLPQMMHVHSNYPTMLFIVQNIGLIIGFGAMLLIALNE